MFITGGSSSANKDEQYQSDNVVVCMRDVKLQKHWVYFSSWMCSTNHEAVLQGKKKKKKGNKAAGSWSNYDRENYLQAKTSNKSLNKN